MSFLLFHYAVSAMQNTVYVLDQDSQFFAEPDLLSEKMKSSRSSNIAHVFSLSVPSKFFFSFSFFFFYLDVKKKQSILFLGAYGNQTF